MINLKYFLWHLLSLIHILLPSTETIPTNNVNTIPKIQITVELKNFANLFICILSDILETIPNAVETNTKGIIIAVIKLPINVIINRIIGCSKFADTIFPVVSISVINIGIKLFINPTKS